MSNMMDDINKYAAIWDSALEKDIFKDVPHLGEPSPPQESGESSDFFGQYLSDEYDPDQPLNEADTQYWAKVSRLADHSQYVDPLTEETDTSVKDRKAATKLGGAHNPIYPYSRGKDTEEDRDGKPEGIKVTQNWGTGGKEQAELEQLKVKLEKLESKLNGLMAKGEAPKGVKSKIKSIKKDIDELSDSLSGNRLNAVE